MAYTVHVEPGKRAGVWVLQCLEVPGALSETTDLREKLLAYKSLPSVQTYLIVEAERLAVRHIAKRADGTWLQEDLTGDVPLPCLGGVLSLPQIYRGSF